MKSQPKIKGSELEKIRRAQKEARQKEVELYLAVRKHKAMKRVFRGIYSYPIRQTLFKVGQNASKNK